MAGYKPTASLSGPALNIICMRQKGRCRYTAIYRNPKLAPTPFPIKDSGKLPFWTGRAPDGQLYRKIDGRRYREKSNYSDNAVLAHNTGWQGKLPGFHVIYFHGQNSTLRKTVIGRDRLIDQIDRSGRRIALTVPQLAKSAIDDHPGNLMSRKGPEEFFFYVAQLHRSLAHYGSSIRRIGSSINRKSAVLVAHSGGWRAAKRLMFRRETLSYIHGIVLLDPVIRDPYRLAGWLKRYHDRFIVVLGARSVFGGRSTLRTVIESSGIPVTEKLVDPVKDRVTILHSKASRDRIAIDGPPKMPIAEILKRIRPFKE